MKRKLQGWISEPDKGVYDALNKGFARSTGEIMGWLNASDMLHAQRALLRLRAYFLQLWRSGVDRRGGPRSLGEEGWPSVARDLPALVPRYSLTLSRAERAYPARVNVLAAEPVGTGRRGVQHGISGRGRFRVVGALLTVSEALHCGCPYRRLARPWRWSQPQRS